MKKDIDKFKFYQNNKIQLCLWHLYIFLALFLIYSSFSLFYFNIFKLANIMVNNVTTFLKKFDLFTSSQFLRHK